MSNAEEMKPSVYYLLADFFVGLLTGAAFVALQIALGTTFKVILIGGLLWPGLYFLGQRYRRMRARKRARARINYLT